MGCVFYFACISEEYYSYFDIIIRSFLLIQFVKINSILLIRMVYRLCFLRDVSSHFVRNILNFCVNSFDCIISTSECMWQTIEMNTHIFLEIQTHSYLSNVFNVWPIHWVEIVVYRLSNSVIAISIATDAINLPVLISSHFAYNYEIMLWIWWNKNHLEFPMEKPFQQSFRAFSQSNGFLVSLSYFSESLEWLWSHKWQLKLL